MAADSAEQHRQLQPTGWTAVPQQQQREYGTHPLASSRVDRFVAGQNISWKKGELLGTGAFGCVYQALNLDTGQLMAVKQVLLRNDEGSRQRQSAQVAELEKEVELLKQLDHPNIVRYLVSVTAHPHSLQASTDVT